LSTPPITLATPLKHFEHPEWIGTYRILQVLGEGAMGVVYHAEETDPVRREVALKVVRPGLGSREVLARFDAERQALAVMNHPGIAQVFSAGATETGQPYFAMELVHGLPITAYCDLRKLSVARRVELFIGVCQAVQHAHQKGVIHRDLKPSNVLVAEHDGRPYAKVIDFGIAKAVGSHLTPASVVTRWGQAIGTPAYMSPEQASSPGLDIDTRSDIYSLGVMLYELLVGRLPVDPEAVGLNAFFARLASGETNPHIPSARVHALGRDETGIAASRGTHVGHLAGQIKGDLDWIVMKALEPDRSRRYESANGLAMDLQRHLSDDPVSARPPTTVYRFTKFARRHRAAVLAVVIVTVVIAASAVLATVGLLRARRAELRAEREAAATRQLATVVQDALRALDPKASRPVSPREILDQGAERIRRSLGDQPVVQAEIDQTIGTVYSSLAMYEPARALLESALRVREHELGPDDPSVAETLEALGNLGRQRGEYPSAEQHLKRALAIRRKALPPGDPALVATFADLATLRTKQGRNAEAESLYTQVLSIEERAGDDQAPQLATHLRNLAVVHWNEKRFASAESLFQRALVIQEKTFGPDHSETAAVRNNLAGVYLSLGRYADALPMYQGARATFEKTLGPTHPMTASAVSNVGETYWKLKRYAEAEPLLRRALAIKEQVLVPGEPSIAVTLNALAGVLRDERRYAEAESLYTRALAIREKAFGPKNANVAETMNDYAELLRRTGRPREASDLAARAGRGDS
jgi:serine/threonine protein kinase/tetratricopeptide (TPR) repeat protein